MAKHNRIRPPYTPEVQKAVYKVASILILKSSWRDEWLAASNERRVEMATAVQQRLIDDETFNYALQIELEAILIRRRPIALG